MPHTPHWPHEGCSRAYLSLHLGLRSRKNKPTQAQPATCVAFSAPHLSATSICALEICSSFSRRAARACRTVHLAGCVVVGGVCCDCVERLLIHSTLQQAMQTALQAQGARSLQGSPMHWASTTYPLTRYVGTTLTAALSPAMGPPKQTNEPTLSAACFLRPSRLGPSAGMNSSKPQPTQNQDGSTEEAPTLSAACFMRSSRLGPSSGSSSSGPPSTYRRVLSPNRSWSPTLQIQEKTFGKACDLRGSLARCAA